MLLHDGESVYHGPAANTLDFFASASQLLFVPWELAAAFVRICLSICMLHAVEWHRLNIQQV